MEPIGVVHTTFAVLALAFGGAVVATRKGTRLHRSIGHLYFSSMLGVNATAFFLYGLFGRMGPFHVLAVVSLVTVMLGILPAVFRRPRGKWFEYHARFMAWSYVGLMAAAGAEVAGRTSGVPFLWGVLGASVGVTLIGAYLIHGGGGARVATAIRRAGVRADSHVARVAAISVMLLTLTGHAAAQQTSLDARRDSAATLIDRGVILHDAARVHRAEQMLQELHASYPQDGLTLGWLGYALYRLSEMPSESLTRLSVAQLQDSAAKVLRRSVDRAPLAETHALLGTITGRKMEGSVWRAIVTSGRWERELDTAERLGPENPRVLLLRGINAFHAPSQFGGIQGAQRYFEAAVSAFAKDAPPAGHPVWGRAEAYAWLGRAYARQNQTARALEAYRRALALEPEYSWVRDVLLPRAEER